MSVTKEESFAFNYPELAKFWHPDNTLRADQVAKGSGKRVFWLCTKGHRVEGVVNSVRKNKNGINCSICPSKKDINKRGPVRTLSERFPKLRLYYSSKNASSFEKASSRNSKRYLWECGFGHEYMMGVAYVAKSNHMCPKCRKSPSGLRIIVEEILNNNKTATGEEISGLINKKFDSMNIARIPGTSEQSGVASVIRRVTSRTLLDDFVQKGERVLEKSWSSDPPKGRACIPWFIKEKVFLKDNYTCNNPYCKKQGGHLCLDHIIPISFGGNNDIGNLQTLCNSCNIRKSNISWTEFLVRESGKNRTATSNKLKRSHFNKPSNTKILASYLWIEKMLFENNDVGIIYSIKNKNKSISDKKFNRKVNGILAALFRNTSSSYFITKVYLENELSYHLLLPSKKASLEKIKEIEVNHKVKITPLGGVGESTLTDNSFPDLRKNKELIKNEKIIDYLEVPLSSPYILNASLQRIALYNSSRDGEWGGIVEITRKLAIKRKHRSS